VPTLLDLIWNHHLATMTVAYVGFLTLVLLAVYAVWRPTRHHAHANAVALSILLALLPWSGLKLVIHEYLGGFALAIARRMPPEHPQLTEFERARKAHDLPALKAWARFNSDPVDARVIVKMQAALTRLPASSFKAQLERELATGYLSRARFEASALSIIQISIKELGDSPTPVNLATKVDLEKVEDRGFR